MLGLPDYAIVIIVVGIAAIVGVGGYFIYYRRQHQFSRFFGVGPKTGSEESVKGIIRQVLRRMIWELETLDGLLEYYNQRATVAVDTDTGLGIHAHVDATQREILKSNTDLSRAAIVAAHFGHKDIVQETGLQQHLPSQGY